MLQVLMRLRVGARRMQLSTSIFAQRTCLEKLNFTVADLRLLNAFPLDHHVRNF